MGIDDCRVMIGDLRCELEDLRLRQASLHQQSKINIHQLAIKPDQNNLAHLQRLLVVKVPSRWLVSVGVVMAMLAPLASARPSWFIRNWQSDAGLPDNTVIGMTQSPDGFLWVATKTGLTRFDGVQFRPWAVTVDGVQAGACKAVLADRRGRLWIAENQGVVVCVDQGRTTPVVGAEHAAGDVGGRLMVEDAEGAVWVSYGGGEVLRIKDGRVRSFTEADGLPAGETCQLVVDGMGLLWFSRGDWVGVFRDAKFRPLRELPARIITGCRAGGIWGYKDGQLWRYTEGGAPVKLGALPVDTPLVTPTAFHEDRDGFLWLGTREAGLFHLDQAGVASATMSQQTIYTLAEDREGNLWVGTRGGGLSQLKPSVVELMAISSATPFTPVGSICQDTAGLLWAVLWPNGEVLRSAGQDWMPASAKDGWSIPLSQCVAADSQGGVWVGTQYNGLHHWQDGAVTTSLSADNGLGVNSNGTGGNQVNALLTSASGEVWIGPNGPDLPRQVLQCQRAGKLQTFHLPLGSGAVVALAIDAAGVCWTATAKGLLLRVRDNVLTDETASTFAGAGAIRCLLGTADGSLWIGYGGQGLGRLKGGHFSHFRMEHGLHDDYLSNILPDAHGRLWFAGNRGIFCVREKELDDFADGRATRIWSVAYGRNDGLPQLQASSDAWPGAQRGTDGRLFFAMQSGVAVVDADNLKENKQPPPVVIERVTVNGKIVATYGAGGTPASSNSAVPLELCQGDAHLYLAPGQRQQVEVDFTALTFTKPESIGFKYRLHGLDADWVEAGTRRVATYAQVPPGHYHFQVRACNSDGVWNETGAALELTAEPFWWETTWFRVTAPLTAAGLLASVIILGWRRRHRRQIERLEMQQATERERARIARDIHDDLGATLTQIVMLSDSSGALAPSAAGSLGKIHQVALTMTQTMDEIVWAVNPRHDRFDQLAMYLDAYAQEYLDASGLLSCVEFPGSLPRRPISAQVRHNLFLAFKEALNNLVRHAAARRVRICLTVQPGGFSLSVEDDGVGFSVDASAAPRADAGNGLANMCARLTAMGGRCSVGSVPGRGTRVVFELPWEP